jgi:hypothetical protein
MKINFFRAELTSIINNLSAYLGKMEIQLDEMQIKEKEEIKKYLDTIDDDEERYAEHQLAEEAFSYNYEIMFPRSLRYSYIILLFLNLESILSKFCSAVREKNNTDLTANLLKGDIVDRSKVYLKRIIKIDGIDDNKWINIEDLSKVRNCIVHTAGRIDLSNNKDRLKQIASQNIGLSIGDSDLNEGYIVLNSEYCKTMTKQVRELVDELFDKAGYGPIFSK